MTNEEMAGFFNTTRPFIQGNPDMLDPIVKTTGVDERKINPCRARSDPGPVSCREPVGSGTLDALSCGSEAPW